jgi:hypothetical protein
MCRNLEASPAEHQHLLRPSCKDNEEHVSTQGATGRGSAAAGLRLATIRSRFFCVMGTFIHIVQAPALMYTCC